MIFLCNFCIAVCLPCFCILEPKYALSFSLKSPSKRTPPGSPTEPYGESCPLTSLFFYISLKFLIKIPLNKNIIPSRKGPRKSPSIFPQNGALVETDIHFQCLT